MLISRLLCLILAWALASSSGPAQGDFLLVTRDTPIDALLRLDLATGVSNIINVEGVTAANPGDVVYDPVDEKIIWCTGSRVYSANLDGTEGKVLADNGDVDTGRIISLAIDQISRSLYFMQFFKTIYQVPLSGGDIKTFLSMNSGELLYDITVHSGNMFWTDFGSRSVVRVPLASGVRQVLITSNLESPSGLAVDSEELCWCDYTIKRVECAFVNGTNRRTIYEGECDRIEKSQTHVYNAAKANISCNIVQIKLSTLEQECIGTKDICNGVYCAIDLYMSDGLGTVGPAIESTQQPISTQPLTDSRTVITEEPLDSTTATESPTTNVNPTPEITGKTTQPSLTSKPVTPDVSLTSAGTMTSLSPTGRGSTLSSDMTEVQDATMSKQPPATGRSTLPNLILEPTTGTVSSTPPSHVDPCARNRGGCGQYCSSSGSRVTCFCSNSLVLSHPENKTCVDPCEDNNGGCEQVCSVEDHGVICGCQEGYKVNPSHITNCKDVDECTGVECANGGTCMDLVNRFFCKCTGDWRGKYCTEKFSVDPAVSLVEPDVGPIAGKTRITLVGENFIPGVLVTLGQELITNYITSTSQEAIVTTPPVDPSLVGETLPISIEFPGFERVNTAFSFTYLANPTLESVRPNVTNVVGGTTLTVRGTSLKSIQDPVLQVTMVHISNGKQNEDVYSSSCNVESGNTMFCWTPQLDLPEAFNGWDKEDTRRRRTARSTKQESVNQESDLTLKTGDQTLDFYIGFKLDGLTSYKNLSDTKDLFLYGKLAYVSTQPKISADNHFGTFIPYTGAKISIKGTDLNGGFEPSDFKVGIGAGLCNDLEVTQNEIICAPPDELPDEKPNQRKRSLGKMYPTTRRETIQGAVSNQFYSSFQKRRLLDKYSRRTKRATTERAVTVHIGRSLDMHAGYLAYDTRKSDLQTIIITVTLTCVGIVALTVSIGLVIYRLKRSTTEQTSSIEMGDHSPEYQSSHRSNDHHGNEGGYVGESGGLDCPVYGKQQEHDTRGVYHDPKASGRVFAEYDNEFQLNGEERDHTKKERSKGVLDGYERPTIGQERTRGVAKIYSDQGSANDCDRPVHGKQPGEGIVDVRTPESPERDHWHQPSYEGVSTDHIVCGQGLGNYDYPKKPQDLKPVITEVSGNGDASVGDFVGYDGLVKVEHKHRGMSRVHEFQGISDCRYADYDYPMSHKQLRPGIAKIPTVQGVSDDYSHPVKIQHQRPAKQ